MITVNGTIIIGFRVSSKYLAIASESAGIVLF